MKDIRYEIVENETTILEAWIMKAWYSYVGNCPLDRLRSSQVHRGMNSVQILWSKYIQHLNHNKMI